MARNLFFGVLAFGPSGMIRRPDLKNAQRFVNSILKRYVGCRLHKPYASDQHTGFIRSANVIPSK